MSTFPELVVIEAVLNGIENAHQKFYAWTNKKAWLSMAPEYMINICIGERLSKLEPKPDIWFEEPVSNYENVNRDGFIDIILNDTNTNETCIVIEVKNKVDKYTKPLEDDVIRICELLQHNKNIEYGLIAFFANVSEKKSIVSLLTSIKKSVQKTVEKQKYSIQVNTEHFREIDKDVDGWSAAAVCIMLKKNN